MGFRALLCVFLVILTACQKTPPPPPVDFKTLNGYIGAVVTDEIIRLTSRSRYTRNAALLGVYVSKYLSETLLIPVNSGLMGIQAQNTLHLRQSSIGDPDFELLQAFADGLQVDVQDMLNRSVDRRQAIDTYSESLTNVATRANTRYKDLLSALENLRDETRRLNRERGDADRNLQRAIKDKDFTLASNLQRTLSKKEQEYAQAELKQKQVQSIVDTLDQLLSLFGERILAIQRNREALIAGTVVVDMPGVADLNLIRKSRAVTRSGRDKGYDAVFDTLQQEKNQPEPSLTPGTGASVDSGTGVTEE